MTPSSLAGTDRTFSFDAVAGAELYTSLLTDAVGSCTVLPHLGGQEHVVAELLAHHDRRRRNAAEARLAPRVLELDAERHLLPEKGRLRPLQHRPD